MFNVDLATGSVVMSIGDTGSFEVEAQRDDQEDWTEDDRALFTVRNSTGDIVIRRIYRLDDETLGNGVILIEFHNADTDTLEPGSYTWELRFIANAYWNEDDTRIVDGDIIQTPGIDGTGNPMPITLKAVQADI